MRMKAGMWVSVASVVVASALVATVALAAAGPGYHVVATYKVGGDGGWDYLTTDSEAHLYFSRNACDGYRCGFGQERW